MNNKHVVKYFEFYEDATLRLDNHEEKQVAYIVQEAIPNGELFGWVSETGPFAEKFVRYYAKQMLDGINYIHN